MYECKCMVATPTTRILTFGTKARGLCSLAGCSITHHTLISHIMSTKIKSIEGTVLVQNMTEPSTSKKNGQPLANGQSQKQVTLALFFPAQHGMNCISTTQVIRNLNSEFNKNLWNVLAVGSLIPDAEIFLAEGLVPKIVGKTTISSRILCRFGNESYESAIRRAGHEMVTEAPALVAEAAEESMVA